MPKLVKPLVNADNEKSITLANLRSKTSPLNSFNNKLKPTACLSLRQNLTATKLWTVADGHFMQQAIHLARQGAKCGEVPVGAVLVCEGTVIGTGFNQPIACNDPTAHAEIVALRQACQTIDNYRLPPNTTLYVTLEPCTMCVGALIHARLTRLVYATQEPRSGMVGSQLTLTDMACYNHKISVQFGLAQSDSQRLLKQFFRARRRTKTTN